LARPFSPEHDIFPSSYYPYGTTAGGQYLLHHGVDIGNPTGTPVWAIASGRVVYAGSDFDEPWGPYTDFYGNLVVIRHDVQLNGAPVHSLYGHLSEVSTQAGKSVAEGETIGLVGSEGIALGPHLHLEIRTAASDYGATINPQLMLAPTGGRGTIVGRLTDRRGQPLHEAPVNLYARDAAGNDQWVASTTTYPAASVNSSALWEENFVLGDWPEGEYMVSASVGDRIVDSTVALVAGMPSIVELWYVP
jgi:murein DD-endopeptidase MepM/ murein hydrolase activator NlpD